MSAAAPAKPPHYWLLAQPLTGRLWRIDARSGRVFRFTWHEMRRAWQEIERALFADQAREHPVFDLCDCPEVPLCGQ